MNPRSPFFIGGVLLVALVIIAVVVGDSSSSGEGAALSPASTSPTGTRGLVLLLQESGVDVRVGVPDGSTPVALILQDRLDRPSRDQVERFVEGGGVLVVADPDSAFSAVPFGGLGGGTEPGRCTLPELADVGALDFSFGEAYRVGEGGSCFGDDRGAFVVADRRGAGTIISVGTPEVFVNGELDKADNSVLALRLLLREEGGSVAILDPNPVGSGDTTLGDLIADRVFQAIIQVGIAFLIYALWRSRRVGSPVVEPQPVAIAGSQFVRAVGGLQQRSRATDRAAATLRADTRRLLSDRYGLPITTDAATFAQLVSTRTGLDRGQVTAVLGDTPIHGEDALVQLGHQLDKIRQEVLDGRTR